MNLQALIAPRSIAIVGASEKQDSWAPAFFRTLREFGFAGPIVPVNPKYRTVWGERCLPALSPLGEAIDLAIILVPAAAAPRVLDEAAQAGIRSAMVVASGFAESGPAGTELQLQLAKTARRYRIPVLGPNVEGFLNYPDRVGMYAADLPPEPAPGGLTVIAHSGAVVWYLAQQASDRAIGLRLAVGVGNGAVLDTGEFLRWAAEDPHTDVVACYLEANRNLESLRRGLDAMSARRKPVIVCAPGGRSDAVRRAVAAHTGTLASDDRRRDAWLRAGGAVLVHDATELFEAAVLLLRYKELRSDGVAAAMEAGGDATLFASAAERAGVRLPALSVETQARLRHILPPFANPTNPVDVTGQSAFVPAMYTGTLDALAAEPGIGVIVLDAAPPRGPVETYWAAPTLQYAEQLGARTGAAVVSVLSSPLAYSAATKTYVRESAIPFLHGHYAGARAIRALQEFHRNCNSKPPSTATATSQKARVRRLLGGQNGLIDEWTAGQLLQAYGIARPAEQRASSPEEAAAAAELLGYPVAVKALSAHLPHKARAGAVRVGLNGAAEVRLAAEAVLSAAARRTREPVQILVQCMAQGIKLLVGGIADEKFGPMVTLRPGGDLTEADGAVFHAAPLSGDMAAEIVDLESERCGLTANPDIRRHAAGAMTAMAALIHDCQTRLIEVEANPLIVSPTAAVAVDALAVCKALTVQSGR
jgi:acetate---CoA ligase (ADP-forming)